MKLSIHKWFKDTQYVAICTENHQHICNIYVTNLIRYFPNYVTGDETIIVKDLFQLLDGANEIFDTVSTQIYTNVKQTVATNLNQMQTRLEYNLEILKQLESYFIKNEYMRFFQGLWHVGIIEASGHNICDKFSQESKKTLANLKNLE